MIKQLNLSPLKTFYTKHFVIIWSGSLGAGIWLIDTLIDYFIFHDGTFLDLLLFDLPPVELYMRSLILLSFLAFGFIIARTQKARARNDKIRDVLLAISHAASTSEDLEKLLLAVKTNLNRVIDSSNFYVALYDEKTDSYSFPSYSDQYDKVDLVAREHIPNSMTDFVRRTGKSALFDDTARARVLAGNELQLYGTPSECWLGAPLIISNKVIGVLGVQSYSDPEAYNIKDQTLLDSIVGTVAIAVERKRAEDALRQSEDKYRSLFNNLFLGFAYHEIVTDENGTPIDYIFREVNPAFEKSIGLKADQLIDRRATVLFPELSAFEPDFIAINGQVALTGKPTRYELHNPTESKWQSVLAYSPKTNFFVTIFEDITERKIAELKLAESERSLLQSQAVAKVGSYVMDISNDTWTCSPVLDSIFGLAENQRRDTAEWAALLHPDFRDSMMAYFQNEVLSKRGRFDREYMIIRIDDKIERWVHGQGELTLNDAGEPVLMVGTIQDITDRKLTQETLRKREDELIQSQKMEAVGQLAAGIAHDFNNILAHISSAAQLLSEHTEGYSIQRYVRVILEAVKRGASVCTRILGISRPSKERFEDFQIGNMIAEIIEVLEHTISKAIQIRFLQDNFYDGLWGDRAQIHQAILNLCMNSVDAMSGGGILTIRTRKINIEESKTLESDDHNEYACFEVADTGTGISEADLKQIFNPFFTTKPPGMGTGLGLSVVFAIVKDHGGWIDVKSEPGNGSRITFGIPIESQFAGRDEAPAKNLTTVQHHNGDGEHILVVEDEPALKDLMTEILETLNYRVSSAANGEEAWIIYQAEPDRFDLVLTDLEMPDMDGTTLAKKILDANHAQKILIISGNVEKAMLDKLNGIGVIGHIGKPFQIGEIAESIFQALFADDST